MFKPALNITEQIADFLAEKIISNSLSGGDRIQEVKLAKELSVSRGSVREALLILERRHLIEVVPRKGAHVNELTCADACEVTALMSMLEERYFRNVKLSARKETLCAELQQVLSAMTEAARNNDVQTSLRLRTDFYDLMLRDVSRHGVVLFESLLPSSQRIYYRLIADTELDLYDVARYYQALLVAIADGCDERVSELICAAARRVESLCRTCFPEPDAPAGRSARSAAARAMETAARPQLAARAETA